ncbi:hypothetical protein [Sutcliffiella halmapala]|uniref:hypothetical protein n=1 Tax=Sutcliffiella halmapala TaxID=79882 RepID=UPI00099528D2|nr:hypothetical protein [Sutcliffiella halmapala]
MKKKNTIENVVNFVQSESKVKEFRHDLPISHELKEVLLTKVFGECAKGIVSEYFDQCQETLGEFIDDHHPSEEKRSSLEHNLFWWRILYEVSQGMEMTFVESYIAKNYTDLKDKPLIISWLMEWEKAVTKFYYVGHTFNDQVLILVDTLTGEPVDVIIYDRFATPPKQGEIVMGTLLPIGDSLYFPIIDFYHFDYEAREPIAKHIKHYYDKHLKVSTLQEAFIHVLSAVLQIEHIIATEQEALASTQTPSEL